MKKAHLNNSIATCCVPVSSCSRGLSARLLLIWLALMMFWATAPAMGLVVVNVDANNSAPTGDQGFSYVGKFGTGGGPNSGVYLGYVNGFNWALTAFHNHNSVTPPDFYLGTESFNQISSQRIGGVNTDLRLVKLDGGPIVGLDPLAIRSTAITNGTAVTIVGHGRVAAGAEQDYDPGIEEGEELFGFDWTGTGTRPKLWGTNEVDGVNINVNNGTMSFRTYFDDIGGTEATLADKDSGSGVFINNGGTWELAGIGFAIDQDPNALREPKEGNFYPNAVYGDESYYVDLTAYRTDILDNMVPEPGSFALFAAGAVFILGRRRTS